MSKSEPPIIFLAFASVAVPGHVDLPRLAFEQRRIRESLALAAQASRCEVIERANVTLDEIVEVFQRNNGRIAVLHYAGHADSFSVLMQDSKGRALAAGAEGLAQFLSVQPGLQLVFLNACSTEAQVHGLRSAGVQSVISTYTDIPDEDWVVDFASTFYGGLAGGKSIADAFTEAQAAKSSAEYAIYEQQDASQWDLSATAAGRTWCLPSAPSNHDQYSVTPAVPAPAAPLWVNVPTLFNLERIVGRQALIDELVERLLRGQSPALSTNGMGGVGKTTLAILLAHHPRIRSHFQDGVLWAGVGPLPDVAGIQSGWALALGVQVENITDLQLRQQIIIGGLAGRRVLVVLDDVWQTEAANALRCGLPGVGHLLTTRSEAVARSFAGSAQSVRVPLLDEDSAWHLLQDLAPEACGSDPETARALADSVGGLPLAIELLGGYLGQPQQEIFSDLAQAALAELQNPAMRLSLAKHRLGDRSQQQVSLRDIIELSLQELQQVDHGARSIFFALGAFAPKPASFDRAAAEAVSGASTKLLAEFVARNLVDKVGSNRLAIHQVVHDYMLESVPAVATDRHRAYYLALMENDRGDWQTIEAALSQIQHAWQRLGDDNPMLTDYLYAIHQYFELRGLAADHLMWAERVLLLAKTNQQDKDVATILTNIAGVYWDIGEIPTAIRCMEEVLRLDIGAGDAAGQAHTLSGLGTFYASLGDGQQALVYFEQALPIQRHVSDKWGEAYTLANIAGVYNVFGEQQRALAYYQQALSLIRVVGDRRGEAASLNNIGEVYRALSDHQQALAHYQQALSLVREVGDKSGEAASLNNIGLVYHVFGDQQQALAYFEQALPILRQVGDKRVEATTLNNIGQVYNALGDQQRALGYLEQALPILRQVGDKRVEATTLSNIGLAYNALGDQQQAMAYYEQALPILRQVGDKRMEATTLNNIGQVYNALGDQQQAMAYYEQALPIVRQVGDKRMEATTLGNMGGVYNALGDQQQALVYYEQALPILRQVGDKRAEAVTRFNIAMVAKAVGDLDRAIAEMEIVVALDEAIHHSDLTWDQYELDRLRRLRSDQ